MQLSIIGQCLLWLGFLGGSLATVLRLENEQAPWQTIPWLAYLGSVLVGVVGVVLLRLQKAAERSQSASSQVGLEAVTAHLQTAASQVGQLVQQLDDMTCEDVLEFVDQKCGPSLAEFADGRQVISDRFGTTVYAAVMTEFASGERYLNRAWSAAADGYVDEVQRSAGYAHQFLLAAVTELEQAGK